MAARAIASTRIHLKVNIGRALPGDFAVPSGMRRRWQVLRPGKTPTAAREELRGRGADEDLHDICFESWNSGYLGPRA